MGIEDYLGVYELWEVLMKIRSQEERVKRPSYFSTAFIVLSCIFSGLTPDKQYKLHQAMVSLIKREGTFKFSDEETDTLASILLLAAEFRRRG